MSKIIGILNLTPDSFSDGGKYNNQDIAIERCYQLIKDGAYAIDIGAESTRPDAKPITSDEEWNRLEEILLKLNELDIISQISVDTKNISTVEKSLKLGVRWINDVSGISNSEIIDLVKKYDAKITIMHNLGIPAKKDIVMKDDKDFMNTIYSWGREKIDELISHGIKRDKIIFDPGVGFGKTAEQSMEIVNKAEFFQSLNIPIMIGHSRKSFLELVTNRKAEDRDFETIEITQQLSNKNIDYIRVHNVKDNIKRSNDNILGDK